MNNWSRSGASLSIYAVKPPQTGVQGLSAGQLLMALMLYIASLDFETHVWQSCSRVSNPFFLFLFLGNTSGGRRKIVRNRETLLYAQRVILQCSNTNHLEIHHQKHQSDK